MSQSARPTPTRRPTIGRVNRKSFSANNASAPVPTRRASVAVTGLAGAPKTQRSSKTSQKLVLLPTAPQTKPLPRKLVREGSIGEEDEEDEELGYDTDAGRVHSHKSEGERLSKEQRRKRGFKRITAYCVAEGMKMKLLAGFLKREHNVVPRIFDEALYAVYHLPLLPGYGPNVNVRSSAPAKTLGGRTMLSRMSAAEETGYQGTYFTTEESDGPILDENGFIPGISPADNRPIVHHQGETTVIETDAEAYTTHDGLPEEKPQQPEEAPMKPAVFVPPEEEEDIGEVVFFEFGVIVFFGLDEGQERSILDDMQSAEILWRPIDEDDWEIEECHYEHNPYIAHPRIYNDFFTLKSTSHLLKLSIAHAFAQSTLLARYETNAQRVLAAPETVAIPRQLARAGALQLKRRDALRLTGRLFKLRRDVNLVSNVLDVPELFWDEASLKDLYDAVREYMEIGGRVEALNEKLGVASDLLDYIHDHLNNSAMERITWIIIWLIVVACVVEMGEVLARLIVHATTKAGVHAGQVASIVPVSRDEALRTLERMMVQSS